MVAVTLAGLGAGAASAQDAAGFVETDSVFSGQISPGGGEVAFIRRTDESQQLIVVNLASNQARAIQTVKPHQNFYLDWVRWKGDGRLIIGATAEVVQAGRASTGNVLKNSDQTYRVSRVFALAPDGTNAVQMFQGQISELAGGLGSTRLLDELAADPAHVMIRAIDTSGIGAWKADVGTGKVERVADGNWQTWTYATDGTGYPVLRLDSHPNVTRLFRRASGAQEWVAAGEIRRSTSADIDDFAVLGAGPGPGQVYMLARRPGNDRAGLFLYDTATGEFGEPLSRGAEADAADPWINPVTRQLMATCEFAARLACKTVDAKLQKYVNALDQFFEGQATVQLVNMSADTMKWLLRVDGPAQGIAYYVFDRSSVQMDKLVEIIPLAATQKLSPTEVVSYASRDGTKLWAYVTAKPGAGPRPLVVMPHGGPESRDHYGFDSFAQFLAAQGYVVVQPNFRGSGGFGETFADAGRGQWGKRMQDDVTDAVKHMADAGVADPKRVCIVGASYGGYVALAGVTLTPDLYKCAVSIAGVSDLGELLRTEKTENGSNSNAFYYWRGSVGDLDTDGPALAAVSPRSLVGKVTAPVLLIHGDDDATVKVRQSMAMHDALKAAGRLSKLVRLPKADHYWANWEKKDRLTLYQETAAFLKQHLN